jgi:ribosomal subunit interface protein
MRININHENIELTDAIKNAVEEKISSCEKYMDNLQVAEVVVGKTTNHHEKGNVFHCSVNLEYPGGMFRAERVGEDLYTVINECRDVLKREITKFKETHRNH